MIVCSPKTVIILVCLRDWKKDAHYCVEFENCYLIKKVSLAIHNAWLLVETRMN